MLVANIKHSLKPINLILFLVGVLGALLSVQVGILRPLSTKIAQQSLRIHELENSIENIVNSYVVQQEYEEEYEEESSSQIQETVERHQYRHKYQIPEYPEEEFTYNNFESQFNVIQAHYCSFDPDITAELDAKNITSGDFYLANPQKFEENAKKYGPFIDQGSHEMEERVRFVVKWSSDERGYGLFAKSSIQAGEVIGVYTGLVSKHPVDTSYSWIYPSGSIGKKPTVIINAKMIGNYMRFVNQDEHQLNTIAEYVPWKNRWYVVYVANKFVPKGHELFTLYESNYPKV